MNIFRLDFFNLRKGLFTWMIIVGLNLIFFMVFYPSMNTPAMQEAYKLEMAAMPQEVLDMLGMDQMPDFTNIVEYFAYTMQYIALAGGIYAALLGSNSLIREESSGTIEFLYAQPITRTQIVFYKMCSAVCAFLLYIASIVVSSLLMILLLRPSGTDPAALTRDTLEIVAGMAFSGLVFMSIGFFLSSIMKSAQQATPAAIGVVFGTYIMGMFAKAFEDNIPGIGKLVYLSPLDYAVPNQIYSVGFELPYIMIGCILIVLTVSATFWIYRKKDLMS